MSGRSPALSPPFSTGCRPLHLDGAAVDRARVLGHGLDEGVENLLPEAADAPTIEAVVDRRMRAIHSRTVLPATAAAQHVEDSADDPTIVLAPGTGVVRRKQRLNRGPGPIIQPVLTCRAMLSRQATSTDLNQKSSAIPTK